MATDDQLVSSRDPWAQSQQRTFQALDQLQGDYESSPQQHLAGILPSRSQQASIGVLKELNDGLIFSCLAKLRAVKAGLECWDEPRLL